MQVIKHALNSRDFLDVEDICNLLENMLPIEGWYMVGAGGNKVVIANDEYDFVIKIGYTSEEYFYKLIGERKPALLKHIPKIYMVEEYRDYKFIFAERIQGNHICQSELNNNEDLFIKLAGEFYHDLELDYNSNIMVDRHTNKYWFVDLG